MRDLRAFLELLEGRGALQRIHHPIDPHLEMTEISDRVLRRGGPALLFENPCSGSIPALSNLFGTPERVALGMGRESVTELREVGQTLAYLKEPEPPGGFKEVWETVPILRQALNMRPRTRRNPPCQEQVLEGPDVDLTRLPVQTCWPGDAGPQITWGITLTRGPDRERQNMGIYRQQILSRNRVIMRWLAHRGGALDYQRWQQVYGEGPFPIAVVLGPDPATILAAVTPVPDTLSEHQFAGLLRGARTELADALGVPLQVPAYAEIVLEGHIYPHDTADEGPFGDHTGYYNEVEQFPVLTVERLTHRRNPIYHTTYTGRPPDEPAVLGTALNELFVPLLQKQLPEIRDFYLPMEGCSYRLAVVAIQKQYPGHAQRVMMGVWAALRQFMYTKFVIVVDDDLDIRDWADVVWALTTRVDPQRDTTVVDQTPIDYLDFASPVSGLGSKMGIDATHKWAGETHRSWGVAMAMDPATRARIDALWPDLGLD